MASSLLENIISDENINLEIKNKINVALQLLEKCAKAFHDSHTARSALVQATSHHKNNRFRERQKDALLMILGGSSHLDEGEFANFTDESGDSEGMSSISSSLEDSTINDTDNESDEMTVNSSMMQSSIEIEVTRPTSRTPVSGRSKKSQSSPRKQQSSLSKSRNDTLKSDDEQSKSSKKQINYKFNRDKSTSLQNLLRRSDIQGVRGITSSSSMPQMPGKSLSSSASSSSLLFSVNSDSQLFIDQKRLPWKLQNRNYKSLSNLPSSQIGTNNSKQNYLMDVSPPDWKIRPGYINNRQQILNKNHIGQIPPYSLNNSKYNTKSLDDNKFSLKDGSDSSSEKQHFARQSNASFGLTLGDEFTHTDESIREDHSPNSHFTSPHQYTPSQNDDMFDPPLSENSDLNYQQIRKQPRQPPTPISGQFADFSQQAQEQSMYKETSILLPIPHKPIKNIDITNIKQQSQKSNSTTLHYLSSRSRSPQSQRQKKSPYSNQDSVNNTNQDDNIDDNMGYRKRLTRRSTMDSNKDQQQQLLDPEQPTKSDRASPKMHHKRSELFSPASSEAQYSTPNTMDSKQSEVLSQHSKSPMLSTQMSQVFDDDTIDAYHDKNKDQDTRKYKKHHQKRHQTNYKTYQISKNESKEDITESQLQQQQQYIQQLQQKQKKDKHIHNQLSFKFHSFIDSTDQKIVVKKSSSNPSNVYDQGTLLETSIMPTTQTSPLISTNMTSLNLASLKLSQLDYGSI
ncbi:MAG: hypothetical protein EZS28_010318, partial [Streblomastix strix]